LAKESGYSQGVCAEVFDAYHKLLVEVIQNGDRLQDFGYLDIETVYVPEHIRGNPQDNNIKVKVKPKFKVKVSIGKTLRDTADKTIDNINQNE
jgi:nucleoid DNA-binding protein